MRRKLLLGCALAALFGYIVWRRAHPCYDFKYPYLVAQVLWRTGKLHVWAQPRYPVTWHVLLAPLAALPIGHAAAAWAVLSFAAVAALPRTLERLSGLSPRQQVPAWVVVLPCLVDALVWARATRSTCSWSPPAWWPSVAGGRWPGSAWSGWRG